MLVTPLLLLFKRSMHVHMFFLIASSCTKTDIMMLIWSVVVVRKMMYTRGSSLLVECPVGSLFVLQCQRVVTGEV